MFEQLFYDPFFLGRRPSGERATQRPRTLVPVDIRDDGDKLVLEAEMPGVSTDDVEIIATPERLTIKGQRKAAENENTVHRERGPLAFERAFALPKGIEVDKVEATLQAGVLTVTLPKRADDKPRNISIKAA